MPCLLLSLLTVPAGMGVTQHHMHGLLLPGLAFVPKTMILQQVCLSSAVFQLLCFIWCLSSAMHGVRQ